MKFDTKSVGIIAAIMLLFATMLLSGCMQQAPANTSSNPASETTNMPVKVTVNNETAQGQSVSTIQTISIKNFAFNPATVTIKAGTTAKWINEDSAAHSIKSSLVNSPVMSPGGSFEFTFTQPGTYAYSCGIHASMNGTVIVQ
jgi:plastocyanin